MRNTGAEKHAKILKEGYNTTKNVKDVLSGLEVHLLILLLACELACKAIL